MEGRGERVKESKGKKNRAGRAAEGARRSLPAVLWVGHGGGVRYTCSLAGGGGRAGKRRAGVSAERGRRFPQPPLLAARCQRGREDVSAAGG